MRRAPGFPGFRKWKHILYVVNQQYLKARRAAGLPATSKLFCARHDFGSFVMRKTGNLKLVLDAMGHTNVKVATNYQHRKLDLVHDAINLRHIFGHTGQMQTSVSS
jgi:hypothetical protein